jgi:hypothetical protein
MAGACETFEGIIALTIALFRGWAAHAIFMASGT